MAQAKAVNQSAVLNCCQQALPLVQASASELAILREVSPERMGWMFGRPRNGT